MLERGGGAHLSSHSHIPGASASSAPPQHLGYGRPHVGVRGERVKPLLEARPYLVQPPVRRQVARHLPPGVPPRRPDAQARRFPLNLPPVGDDQPHGGYVRRRPRQIEIDVHGSKLFLKYSLCSRNIRKLATILATRVAKKSGKECEIYSKI